MDEQRARDDKADVPGGSSRASLGSGHDSDHINDDLPGSLMELMRAMEELRSRIANPGYYRRLANQRIYDQPPEVLQAREEEGARVLAQYLMSLPES